MRSLFLIFGLLGCGATLPVDATDCEHGFAWQCEAEAIAWNQFMARTDTPPLVQWIGSVPCANRNGNMCIPGEDPAMGQYFLGSEYIQLARQDNTHTAAINLSHELLHVHLLRSTGDADGNHVRPEWKTMLPAIDKFLMASGI